MIRYIFNISDATNQTFTCSVDTIAYDFTIRMFRDIMYVSIAANGDKVVDGVRACPNQYLIPKGLERNGNFMVESVDEHYPDSANFGKTITLAYHSNNDEIGEYGR